MSSIFNKLFGQKSSRNTTASSSSTNQTIQRQNTVATTLSQNPSDTNSHVRQRRATITDSSVVADAFKSGDVDQISHVMQKHMIRVAQTSLTQGSMNFGVREALSGSSTRRDSSTGDLREMKTFELFGNPKKNDPQFTATYFPMTDKHTAWAGTPGDKKLQQPNVNYTEQRENVALTTPLSGCSIVEREDSNLAHVQPFSTAGGQSTDMNAIQLNTRKSTTQLQQQKRNIDVFGPEEYGNYDTPSGQSKRHATALVVKDTWGNNQVLSQTIYGTKSGINKLDFNQRGLGPQPHHRVSVTAPPTSSVPLATSTSPTPSSSDTNTLSVPAPKRPVSGKDAMPS